MQLIIFHKLKELDLNSNKSLLKTQNISSAENLVQLLLKRPLKSLVFGSSEHKAGRAFEQQKILLPHIWSDRIEKCDSNIVFYKDNIPVSPDAKTNTNFKWYIISNGKFAVKPDCPELNELITDLHADIVTVNVDPQIRAGCERPIVGPENILLGVTTRIKRCSRFPISYARWRRK